MPDRVAGGHAAIADASPASPTALAGPVDRAADSCIADHPVPRLLQCAPHLGSVDDRIPYSAPTVTGR